jgi:hypothetical protein
MRHREREGEWEKEREREREREREIQNTKGIDILKKIGVSQSLLNSCSSSGQMTLDYR